MEKTTVQFTNPMHYDKLHTLAIEYSMTTDLLINIAVKRLLDDVEFVRDIRVGKIDLD